MKRDHRDGELWHQARCGGGRVMLNECWHLNMASKSQGWHRWLRSWILWGPETATVTSSGSDPRWDGRGNQRQMHRTRTTALQNCPLLCPSSNKGHKPSSEQRFNGLLLVMDQLWCLASSSLPAPEKWQSLQISCGLSSASFLITVCVQEASLLEQVLLLFLHIQIVFIALSF